MAVTRQVIRSELYLADPEHVPQRIEARYMGPDLLCFVDGTELPGFFIDAQAAIDGGKRYCDAQAKARNEQRKQSQGPKR